MSLDSSPTPLVIAQSGGLLGYYQMHHVTVGGTLLCHGRALAGAKVQLWDEDTSFLDADDLLQEQITGADGRFMLKGEEKEWDGLEPYMIIQHNCPKESGNNVWE